MNTESEKATFLPSPSSASIYFHPITFFEIKKNILLDQINRTNATDLDDITIKF